MTSFSPVRFGAGYWEAHGPEEGWRPILDGGRPVSRLVHGWEPVGLYRGFRGVSLLELLHGSGRQATWFLDPSQDRITDDLDRLPTELRAGIEQTCVPALRHLRDALLAGNPGPVSIDPIDPLGLRALNATTIARLVALAGERIAPAPTVIDLRAIAPELQEITVGGIRLSVAALRADLAPTIQQQHMAVLQGGAYEALCPFTGAALQTRTTIVDDRLSACRFESSGSGTGRGFVFYLCNAPVITARELFIPALNCTIGLRTPELPGLFSRLLTAMVRHADLLPDYFARPKRPVNILTGFPGLHVGHVLWNELSGLDRIRRALPPARLPPVIVPDPERGTEVYGPVESVFPEFAGKIVRLPGGSIGSTVYRDGLTAMRVYDRHVSRHLATRVGLVARQDPACRPDHARAVAFEAEGRPVVLIGLRVQNRTVPDGIGFWRGVIEHLSHRLGPIAVVIDGVNARLDSDPSTDYGSFGPRTGRPPVLDELEIVIRLRQHFCDDAVQIISTVGAPMARSLFWAQQARFFVAFWGAGLAKYRWVANKPGLVLTNRANLERAHGDLPIYHSPETMEAPAPLDFIAPEHVADIAASPGDSDGFYGSFTVDPGAVTAALDRLVAGVTARMP